jgi:hypothetical protein
MVIGKPTKTAKDRDMVKSCVWRSGGFLSCADFVVVPDSVLEGDSSRDVG